MSVLEAVACVNPFPFLWQVLGNLKTVLVLLSGWLLFGAQLTTANVTGMVIAMGGMMLYSYVAQKERQAKVKAL